MYFSAVLLALSGGYLTVKSGFYQFLHLKSVFNETFGKLIRTKSLEGFKAMSIALGSTIGIGNIIGVAAAICIGGAGAVFWLLVTGFIGMITKYAEIYICVENTNINNRTSGGPMYVIRDVCKGKLKLFGGVFAAACIAASYFAGNLVQAKSMYEFARFGFSIDIISVTLFTLPILALILFGKDKLYQNFSAVFVPLMSVMYIIATIVLISVNIKNVPNAIISVFTNALGIRQTVGGFSGAVLSLAIRTGIMKGLFTNEAGMGSSPIAHCSAKVTDPHTQGCWGIIEVFIDTVVVCMLTAIAILSSDIYLNNTFSDPFALVCNIFSDVFGTAGLKALSFAAYCFAFASIVGWSFYGIKALCFFSDNKTFKSVYIILFLGMIPLSNAVGGKTMWALTDIFNSMMLIPNSTLLLFAGGSAVKNLNKKERKRNDLQFMPEKMLCRKK